MDFLSQEFLNTTYFDNAVRAYIIALGAFIAFLIVFKLFQRIIIHHFKRLAKKTETDIDDTFVEVVNSLKPPFYSFLAFYFAVSFIQINDFARSVMNKALIIWVAYQVILAVQIVINYAIGKYIGKEGDKGTKEAAKTLQKVISVILWLIGGLFVIANLGVDVTSLIAGMGIGGIAIAFALQAILVDLFSSFAIFFDKPFTVGDFIVVGDHSGTVEKIGIKTTRIRSLQGEEIIIANKDLTEERIQNFKSMKKRRVQFTFGVIYETPAEKLRQIPGVVKDIIGGIEGLDFERAHLNKFNDSSLDYEVIYHLNTGSYSDFMDDQEEIILAILERFSQMGIDMAYPTRTIYTINK